MNLAARLATAIADFGAVMDCREHAPQMQSQSRETPHDGADWRKVLFYKTLKA